MPGKGMKQGAQSGRKGKGGAAANKRRNRRRSRKGGQATNGFRFTGQAIATRTQVRNTPKGSVRLSGNDLLTRLTAKPTDATKPDERIIASYDLMPESFKGTRFELMGKLYDKWKANSMIFKYVPSVPKTMAGSYIIYVDMDPKDTPEGLPDVDSLLKVATSHKGSVKFNINQNASINLVKGSQNRWLFTDNKAGDSTRLTTVGKVWIIQATDPVDMNGAAITDPVEAGILYFKWDVTFDAPQISPEMITQRGTSSNDKVDAITLPDADNTITLNASSGRTGFQWIHGPNKADFSPLDTSVPFALSFLPGDADAAQAAGNGYISVYQHDGSNWVLVYGFEFTKVAGKLQLDFSIDEQVDGLPTTSSSTGLLPLGYTYVLTGDYTPTGGTENLKLKNQSVYFGPTSRVFLETEYTKFNLSFRPKIKPEAIRELISLLRGIKAQNNLKVEIPEELVEDAVETATEHEDTTVYNWENPFEGAFNRENWRLAAAAGRANRRLCPETLSELSEED